MADDLWFVQSPIVQTIKPFAESDIQSNTFPADGFTPKKVEGLLVCGRTVLPSATQPTLDLLLCLGESAGKVAGEITPEVSGIH